MSEITYFTDITDIAYFAWVSPLKIMISVFFLFQSKRFRTEYSNDYERCEEFAKLLKSKFRIFTLFLGWKLYCGN